MATRWVPGGGRDGGGREDGGGEEEKGKKEEGSGSEKLRSCVRQKLEEGEKCLRGVGKNGFKAIRGSEGESRMNEEKYWILLSGIQKILRSHVYEVRSRMTHR